MTERSTRYFIKMRVAYDDGENFMTADVHNMSETGLFLESVLSLKPGTKVTLTPLLEGELGIHELEGEVVRHVADDEDDIENVPGMGIRFLDPDDEIIVALKKHLVDQGEPTLD
jgi:uncharacterized protein (TIGR02266 family)